MSGGQCQRGGGLYSEVQCIMGNGHIGTPYEQTDTSENIIFPQLRWRGVKIMDTKTDKLIPYFLTAPYQPNRIFGLAFKLRWIFPFNIGSIHVVFNLCIPFLSYFTIFHNSNTKIFQPHFTQYIISQLMQIKSRSLISWSSFHIF